MDVEIQPGRWNGTVLAMPSKSELHRVLILSALCDEKTIIAPFRKSRDIEATLSLIEGLGASYQIGANEITVAPGRIPESCQVNCNESGTTFRFAIPVLSACGMKGIVKANGSLCERPILPLVEELQKHGAEIQYDRSLVKISGQLINGKYQIPGNISSQFISGLLLSLPLIKGDSTISIMGELKSAGYIRLTENSIKLFQIEVVHDITGWSVKGNQRPQSPGSVRVSGDWSSGAIWKMAGVEVIGLNEISEQPDKKWEGLITQLGGEVDGSQNPDIIPALAIIATENKNATTFTHVENLVSKESNRGKNTAEMINQLGGKALWNGSVLRVEPVPLSGGTVDAKSDHRMAMTGALAATLAKSPVLIKGAECVDKSYPSFWDDVVSVGGIIRRK